jgi:hypothetical protein
MDCDFTHSPSYIIDFVKHAVDASIVVGFKVFAKRQPLNLEFIPEVSYLPGAFSHCKYAEYALRCKRCIPVIQPEKHQRKFISTDTFPGVFLLLRKLVYIELQ